MKRSLLGTGIAAINEVCKLLPRRAFAEKRLQECRPKSLILLVGGDGFEPPTLSVLVRQFLSMTIAPGGVGKSSLIATETLAMVTGRALLGVKPDRPLKVWLWNLEDPQIETARKIQAACLHSGIKREEIEGRLFANSGRDQPLVS